MLVRTVRVGDATRVSTSDGRFSVRVISVSGKVVKLGLELPDGAALVLADTQLLAAPGDHVRIKFASKVRTGIVREVIESASGDVYVVDLGYGTVLRLTKGEVQSRLVADEVGLE